MSKKRAVVVLAKNPERGRVKTRLAKDVGEDRALDIYNQLYQKTLDTVYRLTDTDIVVYQSPKIDRECLPAARIEARLQSEGDLGERMHHALSETLDQHSSVIIIGTDCPGLDVKHFEKAFEALDKIDVVLGPSTDGGFYLLGSRVSQPRLFLKRTWSHEKVFEHTVELASQGRQSLYILPQLFDIDHVSDWKRWRNEG